MHNQLIKTDPEVTNLMELPKYITTATKTITYMFKKLEENICMVRRVIEDIYNFLKIQVKLSVVQNTKSEVKNAQDIYKVLQKKTSMNLKILNRIYSK